MRRREWGAVSVCNSVVQMSENTGDDKRLFLQRLAQFELNVSFEFLFSSISGWNISFWWCCFDKFTLNKCLFIQVVNLFNMFITYGDTFLPTSNSYDELYYEIVRMHQVFDNLYCMGMLSYYTKSVCFMTITKIKGKATKWRQDNNMPITVYTSCTFYKYINRGVIKGRSVMTEHKL